MTDPNTDQINLEDFDNDWVDEFLTENSEDLDDETEYDDSSIGTEFDIDMRGDWGWYLTLTERGLGDTLRAYIDPLGVIYLYDSCWHIGQCFWGVM